MQNVADFLSVPGTYYTVLYFVSKHDSIVLQYKYWEITEKIRSGIYLL